MSAKHIEAIEAASFLNDYILKTRAEGWGSAQLGVNKMVDALRADKDDTLKSLPTDDQLRRVAERYAIACTSDENNGSTTYRMGARMAMATERWEALKVDRENYRLLSMAVPNIQGANSEVIEAFTDQLKELEQRLGIADPSKIKVDKKELRKSAMDFMGWDGEDMGELYTPTRSDMIAQLVDFAYGEMP